MTEIIGNSNHNHTNPNEFNGRHSASPARTIDSHDSTTGSMDTIVDRSLNREELVQVATSTTMEQGTNTSNANVGDASDEARQDAQSHIYSSPVYDEKPLTALKLTAATLIDDLKKDTSKEPKQELKLMSHQEFKQQLQDVQQTKSAANTIDSRISKKQRCPPEFIKYKETGGGSGAGGSGSDDGSSSKQRRQRRASNECCSAFPLQIVLGLLQLLLAISLVALGSLLIVRDAALSMAGCGIWTGLIAAVTGSLGVVSMRKTQTAFLALSLVCIASSTLALAISGVGLSRDLNRLAEQQQLEQQQQQLELINGNSEVSAACGLIFALFLHFVVSIVSVYRCALQICTKFAPIMSTTIGCTDCVPLCYR